MSEPSLDESIGKRCRELLVESAGPHHIISVSQVPLDLGTNICVGDIGKSWLNIYKQQLVGLRAATTKFIAIAEHDVIYSREHFDWTPPREDTFYYNTNHLLVEWHGNHPELDGMYSRWDKRCAGGEERRALSQLVCSRDLLIASVEERLQLLESGLKILRKLGEPGAFPPEVVEAARIAASGSSQHTQSLLDHHLSTFKHDLFQTDIPNLDIRHGSNFTGPRRGRQRTFDHPYWGKFADLIGY